MKTRSTSDAACTSGCQCSPPCSTSIPSPLDRRRAARGSTVTQRWVLIFFFEFFAGFATISKEAAVMMQCQHASLDIDPKSAATLRGDIMCPAMQNQLHTLFAAYKHEGYHIIMHSSPPCEAYSVLQRTTEYTEAEKAQNVAYSNLVSGVAMDFMRRYANAWTVENPCESLLWIQPVLFPVGELLTVIIHYCRFGSRMKKATRISFSSRLLAGLFGPEQLCPGSSCNSISLQPPARTTRGHVNIASLPHAERSRVPDQLGVKLASMHLDAFLTRGEEVAQQVGPRIVIGYRDVRDIVSKNCTAMISFGSGDPAEWRMPAKTAITHNWEDIEMLRRFCRLTNYYEVIGILQGPRADGMVLVRFRDFEPEWHPEGEFADFPRV